MDGAKVLVVLISLCEQVTGMTYITFPNDHCGSVDVSLHYPNGTLQREVNTYAECLGNLDDRFCHFRIPDVDEPTERGIAIIVCAKRPGHSVCPDSDRQCAQVVQEPCRNSTDPPDALLCPLTSTPTPTATSLGPSSGTTDALGSSSSAATGPPPTNDVLGSSSSVTGPSPTSETSGSGLSATGLSPTADTGSISTGEVLIAIIIPLFVVFVIGIVIGIVICVVVAAIKRNYGMDHTGQGGGGQGQGASRGGQDSLGGGEQGRGGQDNGLGGGEQGGGGGQWKYSCCGHCGQGERQDSDDEQTKQVNGEVVMGNGGVSGDGSEVDGVCQSGEVTEETIPPAHEEEEEEETTTRQRKRERDTGRSANAAEDTSTPDTMKSAVKVEMGTCDERAETVAWPTKCQEETPASSVMVTATGHDLKYVIQPNLATRRFYLTASDTTPSASATERCDNQQCTEDGVENHFRAAAPSIIVLNNGRWSTSCSDKAENYQTQNSMLRPFTSLVHPKHNFCLESEDFRYQSCNVKTDHYQFFYRRKRVLETNGTCLNTYPDLQRIHRRCLVPPEKQQQLASTCHIPSSLLRLPMNHTGSGIIRPFFTGHMVDQKVQQKVQEGRDFDCCLGKNLSLILHNPLPSSLIPWLPTNHTGNGALQLCTGQPSSHMLDGKDFSQSHSPQTDHHPVLYHDKKILEDDNCSTSLYTLYNKLLQSLQVLCRQYLVPLVVQRRLDPTCPSCYQIMPDRGGLQPAFYFEFYIDIKQDGNHRSLGKVCLFILHTPLLPSSLLRLLMNCQPLITGNDTPQPITGQPRHTIDDAHNLQSVETDHHYSKLKFFARVEVLFTSHFLHVLLLSIPALHPLLLMLNGIMRMVCDLYYIHFIYTALITLLPMHSM